MSIRSRIWLVFALTIWNQRSPLVESNSGWSAGVYTSPMLAL